MNPITTVLSAAATYSLTDLVTVKDELGITDTNSDIWLTRAVVQVSSLIASHTKRVFPPELVQDLFDVPEFRRAFSRRLRTATDLKLSRWPLLLPIVSVVQSQSDGTTTTLVEGVDFRSDAINGILVRLNSDTGLEAAWEWLPLTVAYVGGYGVLVQETHTVPSTPFQVTVTEAFSCDQSVAYANGTLLARVASSPAHGQYSVNTTGQYTFNTADTGQVLSFTYATADIPDDLVDITLRLVTGRYQAKGRDPSLIQMDTPGIGTQRFWFGGVPGQTGSFPPDIDAMLDNYRMPVVA